MLCTICIVEQANGENNKGVRLKGVFFAVL